MAALLACSFADAATVDAISRDGGKITINALALPDGEEIKVDGKLDEPAYSRVTPASDFVQQEPKEGAPATERTEVWVFFDKSNIYVAARCLDSHPERMVMNEMRRDHFNLFENENFAVVFDTFHDKRNGYMFYTTPLGGLFDGLISDEVNINRDWNTVWDVKTTRDNTGWSVEFIIPFKSLRYATADQALWGINFRRRVRWKNETSYLTLIPASFGRRGLTKLSSAADMKGVAAPSSSRAFELKPYATGGLRTDRALASPDDWSGDFGVDAKVALTSALTLDATYNTDFAQVEDDQQQVNLSRFSLFFPEKRDFFLEGQGIFAFAGQGGGPGGGGGGPGGGFGPSQTPNVFFSRRIGLNDGAVVPIDWGARVTGKAGGWSLGALQMRTGRDTSTKAAHTDFSVLRLKRDVLRRSTIGMIGTRRTATGASVAANSVYGVDLNLAFFSSVRVTNYIVRSDTERLPGEAIGDKRDLSWQSRFDYSGDRYGFQAERTVVEPDFKPAVGFVPRQDMKRSSIEARFSPRPKSNTFKRVRKFTWQASFDQVDLNKDLNPVATLRRKDDLESRELEGRFETEFQNGDQFNVSVKNNKENVYTPFDVAGSIEIPVGAYSFTEVEASYGLGQQRKFAGNLGASRGGFYGGTRTTARYSFARIEVNSRLSIEPQIQFNWLDLPRENVTTKLISGRINWTISPRMALSGLTQYNSTSSALSTNVRFRWEYQPGNDLFVVYSDGRDTLSTTRIPTLKTRTFLVKFTRLFRL